MPIASTSWQADARDQLEYDRNKQSVDLETMYELNPNYTGEVNAWHDELISPREQQNQDPYIAIAAKYNPSYPLYLDGYPEPVQYFPFPFVRTPKPPQDRGRIFPPDEFFFGNARPDPEHTSPETFCHISLSKFRSLDWGQQEDYIHRLRFHCMDKRLQPEHIKGSHEEVKLKEGVHLNHFNWLSRVDNYAELNRTCGVSQSYQRQLEQLESIPLTENSLEDSIDAPPIPQRLLKPQPTVPFCWEDLYEQPQQQQEQQQQHQQESTPPLYFHPFLANPNAPPGYQVPRLLPDVNDGIQQHQHFQKRSSEK